jgi:hypothetical protein
MQAIPGLGNIDTFLSDFANNPASLEKFINEITTSVTQGVTEEIKEVYRKDLLQRAKVSGGVITDRERELIEKALDGTINEAEAQELIATLGPPTQSPQTPPQEDEEERI